MTFFCTYINYGNNSSLFAFKPPWRQTGKRWQEFPISGNDKNEGSVPSLHSAPPPRKWCDRQIHRFRKVDGQIKETAENDTWHVPYPLCVNVLKGRRKKLDFLGDMPQGRGSNPSMFDYSTILGQTSIHLLFWQNHLSVIFGSPLFWAQVWMI